MQYVVTYRKAYSESSCRLRLLHRTLTARYRHVPRLFHGHSTDRVLLPRSDTEAKQTKVTHNSCTMASKLQIALGGIWLNVFGLEELLASSASAADRTALCLFFLHGR